MAVIPVSAISVVAGARNTEIEQPDLKCADAISYRSVPSCPPSDPYADVAGRPASWTVNTCSPARTVADQLMVMASLTL